MKSRYLLYLTAISSMLASHSIIAKTTKATKKTNPKHAFEYRFDKDLKQTEDSQTRLDKWFIDAKFGAFIHFGVYSHLSGQYKGRGEDHRYSEWIQVSAGISADEYREVAAGFNPAEFDAKEWVTIFKEAGIKYVVITSKHHDGFALFKSAVSDYNIVDGTDFKRDIIKELNDECHRQGLKFGVYYSHSQDWDEPDAPYLGSRAKLSVIHPDLPAGFTQDMDRYIMNKSLPQVEELMKNYKLDLIWFDTPVNITFERAKLFTDMVRKHRPDCLINSRVIQSGKGKVLAETLPLFDYVSIGDKEVPDQKLPLYVESPDSVSSSFGYKTHGRHHYHSEKELIDRMVSTVCAGGNYLLNNGPMGNGKLDPEAIRLYKSIGNWMKKNGESIYNTRRNPFDKKPSWGNISTSKKGDVLYLHVLQWPDTGKLIIKDFSPEVTAAVFLANSQNTLFSQNSGTLTIQLPDEVVDPLNTVIKITTKH